MRINICKGSGPRNFVMFLSKEIRSHFVRNEIVVIETPETIMIREASMEDFKTYTLGKANGQFTYTPKYHEDLFGVWSIEKQGDLFILNEKISN